MSKNRGQAPLHVQREIIFGPGGLDAGASVEADEPIVVGVDDDDLATAGVGDAIKAQPHPGPPGTPKNVRIWAQSEAMSRQLCAVRR
ncbi:MULTISPECIES: hypothetical protein [Nocardioides]|uniref:hypothetical protein n=1 Tax=Nocardioides TaxID=1839 RepID=UPI001BD67EAE|nr:hypothetical protein [Nocardioides aquaticus]